MTTSYYYYGPFCKCCGRQDILEIGTSAKGWQFTFKWQERAETYEQWLDILSSGGQIVDEYGNTVPLLEFVRLIEEKQGERNHAHQYPDYNYTDQDGYTFMGAPDIEYSPAVDPGANRTRV